MNFKKIAEKMVNGQAQLLRQTRESLEEACRDPRPESPYFYEIPIIEKRTSRFFLQQLAAGRVPSQQLTSSSTFSSDLSLADRTKSRLVQIIANDNVNAHHHRLCDSRKK